MSTLEELLDKAENPQILAGTSSFASPHLALRDALYSYISDKLDLNEFLTEFVIEKSWVPIKTLQQVKADAPNGILYICTGQINDGPNLKRPTGPAGTQGNALTLRSIGIQFALHRSDIKPSDNDAIDLLVNQVDELVHWIRRFDLEGFQYSASTNIDEDEAGIPFVYDSLRGHSYFESYWMSTFTHPIN